MKVRYLIPCLTWFALLPTLGVFDSKDDALFAMDVDDLDFSRRVDWAQAGYPGNIPDVDTHVTNVKEAGAKGDGSTDDYTAIQAAIDSTPTPAVIFFPAGTYRIESQINLKSGIVLRGEGSLKTHLEFLSAEGCLAINGTASDDYVDILGGLEKGSDKIVVSSASKFTTGQGGEIRQEDIVPPAASWGEYSVGQMVKVVNINGNTLTIDPPLHIGLESGRHPEILPIRYVEQVGVENLHIRRIDSEHDTSNVNISRAADCWIRGVESDYTHKYHFSITRSLHLEIRDSYIHDAKSKSNGGLGYGVSLNRWVTSVLVENNIFSELRHAMIIQIGVNGCVFGYNYAERNYSDDGWDKTYISIHGHYPFMNLYEGNIVGRVGIADYWGPSGPGNTFFRNRVMGTDKHMEFGPYRGIEVDDHSHRQNIIGNELLGSQTQITFDGQMDMTLGSSTGVLVHGNNVHGTVTWDPSIADQILPASFYLPSKPVFFGALEWPSMGGDRPLGQGTIPAELRRQSGAFVSQPCEYPVGHVDYCRDCGRCAEGEGGCKNDGECDSGLVCAQNVGADYGWPTDVDVCELPPGPCDIFQPGPDWCRNCGPCSEGQGGCDGDAECQNGLICVQDVGSDYGWPADIDVCELPSDGSGGDTAAGDISSGDTVTGEADVGDKVADDEAVGGPTAGDSGLGDTGAIDAVAGDPDTDAVTVGATDTGDTGLDPPDAGDTSVGDIDTGDAAGVGGGGGGGCFIKSLEVQERMKS